MLIEAAFLGAAMLTIGVIVRIHERSRHGWRVATLEVDLAIANRDAAEAQNAELLAEARASRAEQAQATAEEQADVALRAMKVVAQRLSDERRARFATEHTLSDTRRELELAEELLALAHQDVDCAQSGMVLLAVENLRLRADPPWMQQPIAAFHRPIPEGNVVVPNFGGAA